MSSVTQIMLKPSNVQALLSRTLLLLLLAVTVPLVSTLTRAGDDVRLVHAVFRHGDRSPEHLYPTDPNSVDLWPTGLGQLTSSGQQQMRQLGSFLRRRYSQLLPSKYQRDCLRMESSNKARTRSSAELVLRGLYPNITGIPVHVLPKSEDYKLRSMTSCSAYFPAVNHISDVLLEPLQDALRPLLDMIFNRSGVETRRFPADIVTLVDTMTLEAERNLTIPSWALQEVTMANITAPLFPNVLDRLNQYGFALLGLTRQLQRLSVGTLLTEIILHMENFSQETLQPAETKMFLYSTHDTTLTPLLQALGVYNMQQIPTTASCILLELRRHHDGELQVYILYRSDESSDELHPLDLPDCPPGSCSISEFKKSLEDLISVEMTQECTSFNSTAYQSFPDGFQDRQRLLLCQTFGISNFEFVNTTQSPTSSATCLPRSTFPYCIVSIVLTVLSIIL